MDTTGATFTVVSEPEADEYLIRVAGQLDATTASRLQGVLRYAMTGRPTTVVVDMADVDVIDLTALTVLVRARNRASDRGIRLRLRVVRAEAVLLFERAGAHDLLAEDSDGPGGVEPGRPAQADRYGGSTG